MNPFENDLAESVAAMPNPFERDLEQSKGGFNPIEAVTGAVSGAYGAVKGAIQGQHDPAFEGVEGFTGGGLDDIETASAVNRAKALGVSDEAYGTLVKEALGPRLKNVETDRHGQEIITYTDDHGRERREYINSPGLDLQDVDRLIASSTPYLAAGGLVGKAVGGMTAPLRALAQAGGQATASVVQDTAAGTGIDPVKMGIAAGGGLVGEAIAPLAVNIYSLFRKSPGLVSDGKLTERGIEALRKAGIDLQDLTPEFLDMLAAPDISRSADDVQAALRAQSDQFGVRSSVGQRSLDPEQLAYEEQARRGLLGQGAKNVASDFDAGQRVDVVQGIADQSEKLGGRRVDTPGEAGAIIQHGLREADDAANKAVSEAFTDVDVRKVFPQGIPKKSFDDLGVELRNEIGTSPFDERLTPTAVEMVQLLDDFSKGKVRQPKIDLLKKGAAPKSNFDSVRRALNERVGDAVKPADVRAAMKVKTAYNNWVKKLAEGALKSGNPEEFAKLQAAIGLTARTKKLFEVQGPKDAGGKIIKKILEEADSPEGAISSFLTTGFKQPPKNGAVNAAKRMKTILQKEQPEAWHAMRQAYWLKLSRGQNLYKDGPISRSELDTALGQVSRNIDDALKNQRSLMEVLYTPDEIKRIRAFGRSARSAQSVNPNPSGTAYEAQRMRQHANDSILPNFLRRQAAGQQIKGHAVRAVFWRTLTKRAVSILGARGEAVAAGGAGRTFSQDLPKSRFTGGGGLGGALAVQDDHQ